MVKEEKSRIVKTGLADTLLNYTILDNVRGQMGDGIWENTKGMTSYWYDASIGKADGQIVIEVNPNPRVFYKKQSNHWNRRTHKREYYYLTKSRQNKYFNMSDAEIVNFFKNKIRYIVRVEDKDNKEMAEYPKEKFHEHYCLISSVKQPERKDFSWKADNDLELSYLGRSECPITVGDAYKVVKLLSR